MYYNNNILHLKYKIYVQLMMCVNDIRIIKNLQKNFQKL